MENNISKYQFTVEPFSEDLRGSLSWGTLGNLLLRCASLSAGTFGFGYEQVVQRRLSWVLSRLIIDVPAMPRTGEQFEIQTWVKSVYRQFTDRHYAIMHPDGTAYGYAVSTWALIDIDTRQPVDLSQMPDDLLWQSIVPEREAPIASPTRLRLQTPELLAEHVAAYTDLDINGHVNSIRYIELLLDRISKEDHAAEPVTRIEMQYAAESGAGDRLQIFADRDSDNARSLYVIKRDDGTLLCRGILHQKK